jgi:hypothetical protein
MPYEAERFEILNMVQAKQITPEDGARLLKAITDDKSAPVAARANPTGPTGPGRWFKLSVEEPDGERVNLSVPLQAVPAVLRFAARWVPEDHREELSAAADALATGFRGDIVRIEQPNGERVRIWIE